MRDFCSKLRLRVQGFLGRFFQPSPGKSHPGDESDTEDDAGSDTTNDDEDSSSGSDETSFTGSLVLWGGRRYPAKVALVTDVPDDVRKYLRKEDGKSIIVKAYGDE